MPPTPPELVSSLRAGLDRVEETLILQETELKSLRRNAELERRQRLKLADELNAAEETIKEGRIVIFELEEERSRLEEENSSLKSESEDWRKRILRLEDDVKSAVRFAAEDYGYIGGVESLESLFDYIIAVKENESRKNSAKAKLEGLIEKQKEEYAEHEKVHKFEMQKMQKVESEKQLQLKEKDTVENELKDCRVEIQQLKEKLSVMEGKHREGIADIENKHGLELIKVEKKLKVCEDALDESEKKQKSLEEKHKSDYEALEQRYHSQRLEVEVELKNCKAELKGLQERMDKRKNRGMDVIDVDDLCESMPPTTSPQQNIVGTSGKSSRTEAILLSDSDDDNAPLNFSPLKRKQISSPNSSCGPPKQRRILGRCNSVVSGNRNRKDPSICDPKMSRQRSCIGSSTMLKVEYAASSTCTFSSDDSGEDSDINIESILQSTTNQA